MRPRFRPRRPMADDLDRRLAVLDEEIAQQHEIAKTTTDVFTAGQARIRIDELLEQRHELAPGSDPD